MPNSPVVVEVDDVRAGLFSRPNASISMPFSHYGFLFTLGRLRSPGLRYLLDSRKSSTNRQRRPLTDTFRSLAACSTNLQSRTGNRSEVVLVSSREGLPTGIKVLHKHDKCKVKVRPLLLTPQARGSDGSLCLVHRPGCAGAYPLLHCPSCDPSPRSGQFQLSNPGFGPPYQRCRTAPLAGRRRNNILSLKDSSHHCPTTGSL